MFSLKFILTIVGMLFSPKFANAFIAKAFGASRVNALFVSTESVPSGERINKIVDLESPKVVSMVELKAGEKCVVCRCWQSKTFPLCDGSHMKHNKATGDNLGPAIISVAKIVE